MDALLLISQFMIAIKLAIVSRLVSHHLSWWPTHKPIHQHLTMDSILPTVSLVHCLTPQATLDAFVRHYNHLQTTDHATGWLTFYLRPLFIPHPDGCIGPHVNAILLCHSPVPRLLPRSSPSVGGLVWWHLPSSSSVVLALSCNLSVPSVLPGGLF